MLLMCRLQRIRSGRLLKASGCISIALESFSSGNAMTAQAYLEQVHPETLFRAGISIIMKVRKEFLGTCLAYQRQAAYGVLYGISPWAKPCTVFPCSGP